MSASKLPAILVIGVLLAGVALVARKYYYKPRVISIPPAPTAATAPPPHSDGTHARSGPETDLQSLRMRIESSVSMRPKDPQLRMQAARAYLQAGVAPLAMPHLQAAARMQPKDVITWVALGDTATLANDLSAAEAAYQRANALDPG